MLINSTATPAAAPIAANSFAPAAAPTTVGFNIQMKTFFLQSYKVREVIGAALAIGKNNQVDTNLEILRGGMAITRKHELAGSYTGAAGDAHAAAAQLTSWLRSRGI